MTPPASRILATSIFVPVLALLLAGCIFGQGHGGKLETAAQAALDASDQHGGVEAFNTSEGLGDSYNLDICVESPASATAKQLADRVASTLNAVGQVATDYAQYVSEVHVRVVDEAKHAQDLDDWCRGEDNGGGLLDLQEAVTMIPNSGLGIFGSDLSIGVPYGEIVVVVPTPTPTPTPTPSATP